jgi:plastocyanin
MISDDKMEIKSEPTTVTEPDTAEQISVNSYIMPKTATVGDVLLIEVEFRDDDENVVDHVNYDISGIQDGDIILSEPGSHRHPGKHPIHETTVLGESLLEIQVTLQGLGHGDDISEPKGIVTTMTVVPEPEPGEDLTVCTMQWDPMCGVDGETYGNLCMLDAADVKLDYEGECVTAEAEPEPEAETLPMSQTISIPEGVGVPGCETTTECYLPYEVNVAVGATVTWNNGDTAVHTVTSGNPSSGVNELFDSSIFMSGDSFEFTFNDVGTFDYFCMVHPWMAGIVNVS